MSAITRPRPATEAQLQRGLIDAVTARNGRCYHTTYAVGSERGYPDLTCVVAGRVWWFEVKGPKGRLSDPQVAWIEAINAVAPVACVVWPDVQRADSGFERWPTVPHRAYDDVLSLITSEETS